jgi:hypothetical protein
MRAIRVMTLSLILCAAASVCAADPPVINHGTFNLPQALYEAGVATGVVLVFASRPGPRGDVLDVDAFPSCPAGQTSPIVLGARLTIEVPRSTRYPEIPPGRTFVQTNDRISTRWPVWDAPPGTMFTVDVSVSCTVIATGQQDSHIDRYVFKVVATPDGLRALIDLFRYPAGGIPPVPLITSDSTYHRLKQLADTLAAQISAANYMGAKSTIAAMKEFLNGGAVAGTILNTADYPARALLLLDLEAIAAQLP